MPTDDLAEVNVNRWWWLKRLEYNKGLLISGAIAFIIGGFSSALLFPRIVHFLFMPFAIVYTVYIVIANIAFTLGWIMDIAFNRSNDDNFRLLIFKCGYWLSVIAPPLSTLGVLLFIITTKTNFNNL